MELFVLLELKSIILLIENRAMKKVLLLIMMAIALVGCKKSNAIVGTWVQSVSEEAFKGGDVGMVSNFTFNSDGTWEGKHEVQMGVRNENFSVDFSLIGKWEMPTNEKLIIHIEKAIIEGEESDIKEDKEYAIVNIDAENLEMMSGGKTIKYRRK